MDVVDGVDVVDVEAPRRRQRARGIGIGREAVRRERRATGGRPLRMEVRHGRGVLVLGGIEVIHRLGPPGHWEHRDDDER